MELGQPPAVQAEPTGLQGASDGKAYIQPVAMLLARFCNTSVLGRDMRTVRSASAPVGCLVSAQVDARDVAQLVLGAPPCGRPVGEHHRGAAHAEQRVGDEHAAVVARVPVQRDVLGGHHQRIRVALHLRGDSSALEQTRARRVCTT
jgi:hypothetical protein